MRLTTRLGGPRRGTRHAKMNPRAAKSTPGAPQEPAKRRKKENKKATYPNYAQGWPVGGLLEPFGLDVGPSEDQFRSVEDVRIIFYIALNLRRKASGSDGSGAEDLRKAPPSNVYTCLNFPM